MPDFLASALMAIIMGIFGWSMLSGVVRIYREKEGFPLIRFFAMLGGILLGSIWIAVPIMLLVYDPIGTIFGFFVVAGAVYWMLRVG